MLSFAGPGWCLVFSYYLAPPLPRGLLFVCATAVLAQGSRPVKCFVSGGIEQKNSGVEQARRGARDEHAEDAPATGTTRPVARRHHARMYGG